MSRDIAHIYLGPAIFLTSALVLKKPITSYLPLAALVTAELVNESLDVFHLGGIEVMGDPQWSATLRDILLTLSVPVVLHMAARHLPLLKWRVEQVDDETNRPPTDRTDPLA